MSRLIETERLVLRPWTPADAPAALAVFAAPGVREWLWPDTAPPTSVEEMGARIARWQPDDHAHTDVLGHWAVCDRTSRWVWITRDIRIASVVGGTADLPTRQTPAA